MKREKPYYPSCYISITRPRNPCEDFLPLLFSYPLRSTIKVTVIHPSAGQNHNFRSTYIFVYCINSRRLAAIVLPSKSRYPSEIVFRSALYILDQGQYILISLQIWTSLAQTLTRCLDKLRQRQRIVIYLRALGFWSSSLVQ